MLRRTVTKYLLLKRLDRTFTQTRQMRKFIQFAQTQSQENAALYHLYEHTSVVSRRKGIRKENTIYIKNSRDKKSREIHIQHIKN